jgi:hypothetical protein
MTSAKPECGLQNAFDINGQTTAIYSGSARAVFSAEPQEPTLGEGTRCISGQVPPETALIILTAQSGTDTDGTCKLNSTVPATARCLSTRTGATLQSVAPAINVHECHQGDAFNRVRDVQRTSERHGSLPLRRKPELASRVWPVTRRAGPAFSVRVPWVPHPFTRPLRKGWPRAPNPVLLLTGHLKADNMNQYSIISKK